MTINARHGMNACDTSGVWIADTISRGHSPCDLKTFSRPIHARLRSSHTNMQPTINILGREFTVTVQDLGSEFHGQMHDESGSILISNKLSPAEAEKTLLHEVIHAAIHESGWQYALEEADVSEEGIVRALEHALWRAGYRLPPDGTLNSTDSPGAR